MRLIYFLFLILITCSCVSPKRNIYEFDPLNLVERDILLSDIVDEITYVPLDDTFLIKINNYFNNPTVLNDLVYIADSESGLLVFNKNGDFIRKIGEKGRGPGEYRFAQNFSVDENTGTIYIKNLQNIIYIYSSNGDFRGQLLLDQYTGSIDVFQVYNSYLFGSYNIQFSDNNEYEWVFYDTLGIAQAKKEMSQPNFRSNFLSGGGYYYYNEQLHFWNQFLDTVYKISPDFTYSPSFVYKSGEYRLPKEYFIGNIPDNFKFMTIDQILETDNFITIRYSFYQQKNGLILVDKASSNSYWMNWEIGGNGGILNDFDGGERFLPLVYYVENNREFMIGFIEPFKLKNIVISDDFKRADVMYPEKKQQLQTLAASLEETDNPVLMIVRLKK